jgi:hypothetical protein
MKTYDKIKMLNITREKENVEYRQIVDEMSA